MKDLMNLIHLVPAIAPSAGPSDNTAQGERDHRSPGL